MLIAALNTVLCAQRTTLFVIPYEAVMALLPVADKPPLRSAEMVEILSKEFDVTVLEHGVRVNGPRKPDSVISPTLARVIALSPCAPNADSISKALLVYGGTADGPCRLNNDDDTALPILVASKLIEYSGSRVLYVAQDASCFDYFVGRVRNHLRRVNKAEISISTNASGAKLEFLFGCHKTSTLTCLTAENFGFAPSLMFDMSIYDRVTMRRPSPSDIIVA